MGPRRGGLPSIHLPALLSPSDWDGDGRKKRAQQPPAPRIQSLKFRMPPTQRAQLRGLLRAIESRLKPGAVPSQIYHEIREKRNHIAREHEIAKLVFEKIVPPGELDAPNIRRHVAPAALLNGDLVLAAEAPLLQDSAVDAQDLVPLAVQVSGEPPRPLGRIALGLAGAAASRSLGLTELLALDAPPALLALLRSYTPPQRWTAQLQVLPLPASPLKAAPPLAPAYGWDLLKAGLPADNWEGMAWGPRLADDRVVLVLVSDDNFNPLQRSWVSLLLPRRGSGCPSGRFQF